MGELLVELLPFAIGLAITPAAIAGGILLLGTPRPFANAGAFTAAFVLIYGLLAAVVVGLAASQPEPLLSERTKHVFSLVIGVLLLGLALLSVLRAGTRRARQEARQRQGGGFLAMLDKATPPLAFALGAGLAILNPNVPILLAGLAVVAAAPSAHVAGGVFLVLASVLGLVIPMAWRWLSPEGSRRGLSRLKDWLGRHSQTVNLTVLVVFGTIFTIKGLSGL